MKLLMLSGLPASGKSTYAKSLVESGGNWVRVNKDLIRTTLHFDKWSGRNEDITQQVEIAMAIAALNSGRNVIVDDTNLSERHRNLWSGVAKDTGHTFETKSFTDVSWLECVNRDATREKKVGAHVIINMALQYNLFPSMKDIIVCDIDGTIADGSHRVHHLKTTPKDWKKYFSLLHLDSPIVDVISDVTTDSHELGAHVILVSARPEDYREETIEWLNKHDVTYDALVMRRSGDSRDDDIVKEEIYNKYLKQYNILKVYDDRPRVIRMWKSKGLEVVDCGDGVEF